ncbi:MAG: hypothetical protein KF809_13390 [Chloroflexi bacterium]|nr:hypothetical protein [Chloroflexota bacterium]
MTTYRVIAQRDERYWFMRVEGIGATQARYLGEATHMARDLVVTWLDLPIDTADVEIDLEVRLPSALRERVDRAIDTRAAVTEAAARASAALRDATWSLSDEGMTTRDIAFVLGVTRQRVQQLLAERETPSSVTTAQADAEHARRRGRTSPASLRGIFVGQAVSVASDEELFGTGEAWDVMQ